MQQYRQSLRTAIFMLLLALFLTGCFSRSAVQDEALLKANQSQSANILSGSYVLRQGDQVKLWVIEYPEFDTTAVISETGTIPVKLLGEVHLEGLTKNEAIAMLRERIGVYARSRSLSLGMTVLTGTSAKLVILGAVARQDTFALTSPISLLEAIAASGGTQPDSDLRRIKVFRRDSDAGPVEVDLTRYFATGNIREVPTIGPGDIVYVPREENFIREFSGYLRDTLFLFGLFSISR
ncbi:MAG: polysaccharide biosynthesis/export family protein [Acidobacteriota bacterium]